MFRANLGTDKPEIQLLKEKVIADLALKHGVPSNKILYVDISRKNYPFDFQVQEKFRGVDAEKIFNGTKDDYDKYSFNIGQIIAKMGAITFSGYGHFDDSLLLQNKLQGEHSSFFEYISLELEAQVKTIVNNNFLSSQTGEEILKIFESHKQLINSGQSGLVHYDLADHNLRFDLKTYKVVAVYDWEAAVCGDPCLGPCFKSYLEN